MRGRRTQVGNDFARNGLRALGEVSEELWVNVVGRCMHDLARKERSLVDSVARGSAAVAGFGREQLFGCFFISDAAECAEVGKHVGAWGFHEKPSFLQGGCHLFTEKHTIRGVNIAFYHRNAMSISCFGYRFRWNC